MAIVPLQRLSLEDITLELRQRCKCLDKEEVSLQLALMHQTGDLLCSLGCANQLGRMAIDKADLFEEKDWLTYLIVESHVDSLVGMRKSLLRFTEVCLISLPSPKEVMSSCSDPKFVFFHWLDHVRFRRLEERSYSAPRRIARFVDSGDGKANVCD